MMNLGCHICTTRKKSTSFSLALTRRPSFRTQTTTTRSASTAMTKDHHDGNEGWTLTTKQRRLARRRVRAEGDKWIPITSDRLVAMF